jgi:hypothetical protein
MNNENIKQILIGLTKIVRLHHIRLDQLSEAVTAIRGCLDADDDKKIDAMLRHNLVTAPQFENSIDQTTQLLNQIIQQLELP